MDEQVIAELERLYAMLPTIECKGFCWNACGPIDMSDTERERIRERGYEIEPFTHERALRWANDEPLHCAALTAEGRCAVYDVRPLVCRLWGVAESMPCEWGCKPNPGYLRDGDAMNAIGYAMEVGGKQGMEINMAQMQQMMEDPETGPLIKRIMRGDRTAEPELIAILQARR